MIVCALNILLIILFLDSKALFLGSFYKQYPMRIFLYENPGTHIVLAYITRHDREVEADCEE